MNRPWRRQTAVDGDEPPKRRTQSSSAELQPADLRRRRRLLAKDRYRIVVMGSAAVGKTCIISRLLYERFVSEYEATVEELHSGDYELNGRPLTLDILDTSGTFPPLHIKFLNNMKSNNYCNTKPKTTSTTASDFVLGSWCQWG